MLARSAGIPARLVTGFAPGTADALTGRFVVREHDAHAWAEIYFPGIGWQGFDPTAPVPLAGDATSGGGSWLADRPAQRGAARDRGRRPRPPRRPRLPRSSPRYAAAGPGARRGARRALHRLERVGRKAGRARRRRRRRGSTPTRSRNGSATTGSTRSARPSTPSCSRPAARPKRHRAEADAVLTSL